MRVRGRVLSYAKDLLLLVPTLDLNLPVRPWPNDSIFHSIVSSTFDLKVVRLLSVVEHRWPNGSIFRSTFLWTFQLLIFPQRVSAKNIYHHKYLTA